MDTAQNTKGNAVEVVTQPPESAQVEPAVLVRPMFLKKKTHPLIVVFGIIFIILVVLAGVGAMVFVQAKSLYAQALAIQPTIEKAQGNLKSQDLPALKGTLGELLGQIQQLEISYRKFGWMKPIPYAGAYVKDGERAFTAGVAGVEAAQILAETIEPYADILGFQGSGSFSGGTAEDRIVVMLQTLEKVTPKLDDIAAKLKIVDDNLQQIDEKRYPWNIKDRVISEELAQAKELVHTAAAGVTDAKPALEALPDIVGMNGEKKYMVLFHNDGELRGTGGFMTAYADMRADKGRIYAERSSDIYDLDNRYKSRLQPPELVAKLLNMKYWYLRDLNLSPDFKENMDLFTKYYLTIPNEPKVDGVIGIDTNFVVDLLGILGPIDVPGFGRFSNDNDPRCDCPQVVYQLESIADRPVQALVENRKGVLGPLMKETLTRAYGAPKAWWDDLFKAFAKNVSEKHVVFYFRDEKFQQAAQRLNATGTIADAKGDYLLITDVNFGGAKANFFVKQDVKQELQIADDGIITKTLTVTYTNPAPASNCNLEAGKLCLNAPLPNWVRIYVPKGSELVESVGLDEAATVTEEFGKTVFTGFLTVNPQSSAKTVYRYKLPWKKGDAPGSLLVQKQVGKDIPHYQVELPKSVEEFDLAGDKTFTFSW